MIFQFFGLQVKDVQLSAKEGNVCPLSRTFYCTSGGWSWLAGTQVILVLWPSVCSLLSPWSHLPEAQWQFLSLCPSLCLSVCLCLPFSPTHMPTASPSSLSLLCCLLLLFSSYKHYWGNFSILVALATTSNQKTGGSKAIVSSTKFPASRFPVPTGTLEKAMAPHSSTFA